MSGEKASSPCNKFQANIFNKSKCQNCFKSRELHLLNDHNMEQAKPIYGGWLCLAPEGTDFDNPMQRSRKWQRRFFILYEHGSLSFALDELPSTLPQGTVNLNLCADIADAEPRTGQRNALCIATPEREIFIRGDNKEIINGWSEQLAVYLRTSRQNQKKKRKVEPVATQEPSPAKMAATDPRFPSSESAAESGCGRWQEDQQGRGPGLPPMWTVTDPLGPEQTPSGSTSTCLCPASRDSLTSAGGFVNRVGCLDLVAGGSNQLTESNNIQTSANNKNQSRDKRLLGSETTEKEREGGAAVSRQGRSEARASKREKLQSCGDIVQLTAPPPQRRSRSLDRRTSDTVMTPDLLNFKKGWMVKLDETDQWKKYWFVLSTDSLRYYKDSIAEEASDLEGEIDLTKCYNVSEYQVQRNYGFQIHTPKDVYTLSAMTSGIRKNWIQALMRNVHPANAPDVASLPGHHAPCSPPEALPKPDVTRDSPSADLSAERDPHSKRRTVTEKRREGRYRTFDWAEFRPQNKPAPDADPPRTKPLCSLELGDLERRKRREERRRRYESMLGISLGREVTGDEAADVSVRAMSPKSQQRVEEEIEECWRLVEKTAFRLEGTVPLLTDARDAAETEKLLETYRKKLEDLKVQLAESESRRLELEAQLSTAGYHQHKLDPPLPSEEDTSEQPLNSHSQTLKDVYEETRELLQQQNIIRQDMQQQLSFEPPPLAPQTPRIWLHDTEGNLQELGDLTPLLSPASDSQDVFPQSDGETAERHPDVENQPDGEDRQQVPGSETQINTSEYSSLILEEGDSLSCCVEHQATVRRLELLTSQNEALNQRNQEMLNQLTEADREIERLKAELSSSRYTEPLHLPEVEQLGQTGAGDLEMELSLRNQQLLEAQSLIASLEENLRETEALLQLNVPEESAQEESESAENLLRCLEATEAKLTELERQLDQSELTCAALQTQNAQLKEADELHRRAAAEAEADIRRLNEELEKERPKDGDRNGCVSGEERIQKVIEGMVMRLNALGKLLEVIDRLDVGVRGEEEENPAVASQLKWEEEFWSLLLNKLESNPSQLHEEKPVEELLSEVTERMIVEKQMLLLALLSGADEGREGLDIIWNIASEEAKKQDESRMSDFNDELCEIKRFRGLTQMKISLLSRLASSVSPSAQDQLQLMADRLSDFHFSEHPWSGFIHSAATEAFYCCHLSRLRSKHERELEETRQKLLTASLICSDCVDLMEENRELRARLSHLEGQRAPSAGGKMDACCQTDADIEVQVAKETGGEETVECMEIPPSRVEGESETADEDTRETSDASREETAAAFEAEPDFVLRRRVKELEEQLSVVEETMKDEFDGKMSFVQTQHEEEMERLKVTCERGFASVEECHLKVVEELQRRHQQEVERLLVERDRLLEEESAATATAIAAIGNAHRLELEREVQRRSRAETGDAHLEDVYRQHSEELASYQRELQALSQQFSLKCLENEHLVQALDAERKALCQCQQENQDLRTRNQELNGHLAAEISRLCSLVRQDEPPLGPRADAYEMEINLRVKESEVQSLKQEVASLKDELQSAQRDKRNAVKTYKDAYGELSAARADSERELDELRENLRLARRALDHNAP
ncbi:myosin phosphatase Rho-interacting protein-like isoform X1 [Morone saxatilis]|uniref:myosin phosphatase Rho-interacting protein-like isoform X1 n=1 Tax=Morone saxatilis TaxID=34816 RepID=UPI0015E1E42B|nr:myosin phosphatase Rho-interacting protein-like isoform X1 [Morone saxatilis]